MEPLRALIVDDEQQSRSLIKKLLSHHFPGITTGEANCVDAAIAEIRQLKPELVFLDVQMRGESGFDLLDKSGPVNFGIIFTTAHSEFALKAFRYSALDYLMKPIDEEEFRISVEKAIARIEKKISPDASINYLKELRSDKNIFDKIIVPTTDGFILIALNDILFCRATGNYTEFHLRENKKIISSHTLGYYDDMLKVHNFFRAHRSHLINMHHIKMYKKGNGGIVVLSNGEEIEISRGNKEAFLRIFNF